MRPSCSPWFCCSQYCARSLAWDCVCERERERERVCVCVCVYIYHYIYTHTLICSQYSARSPGTSSSTSPCQRRAPEDTHKCQALALPHASSFASRELALFRALSLTACTRTRLHRCPGAGAEARCEGRVHGGKRRPASGSVHHRDESRGGDEGGGNREPLTRERRLAEELQRPAHSHKRECGARADARAWPACMRTTRQPACFPHLGIVLRCHLVQLVTNILGRS